VRTISRSRPRDLRRAQTEFYVSDKRDEKAERVKTALNELLNLYGVVVERVSTKDYRFNPAYQQAIEDKKIAEQVAEQNRSATRAAEEEWLRKLEEAKAVKIVDRRRQFRRAQIQADAYYGQQTDRRRHRGRGPRRCEGHQRAEQGPAGSGEVMVKLKVAEALAGKRIPAPASPAAAST
jgi:hypothetical protein